MSKILIFTNHSYMLYRFRLELIQELKKAHEVVLSMPFVGHEDDFKALGIRCIETSVDRPSNLISMQVSAVERQGSPIAPMCRVWGQHFKNQG